VVLQYNITIYLNGPSIVDNTASGRTAACTRRFASLTSNYNPRSPRPSWTSKCYTAMLLDWIEGLETPGVPVAMPIQGCLFAVRSYRERESNAATS
jgi:hypothetical protein